MKKFILGVICGALIFGGSSVLADSLSLVGKTVDGEVPVYYNDEPLVAKAITVQGTSYLPVRTIGNTLGVDIQYKDGAVYVEKQEEYEAIKQQVMKDIKKEMRKEELKSEIAKLQSANERIQKSLEIVEREIEVGKAEGSYIEGSLMTKQNLEKSLQQNLQKIKELEAQLAELEATEE
jgi:hypothetical protein